jgi:hypothetical protein
MGSVIDEPNIAVISMAPNADWPATCNSLSYLNIRMPEFRRRRLLPRMTAIFCSLTGSLSFQVHMNAPRQMNCARDD